MPLRPVPPAQDVSPQWLNLVSSESIAIRQFSTDLNPSSVAAASIAEETFSSLTDAVTGKAININAEDIILQITKPTQTSDLAIVGFRIPAANQIAITFLNNHASNPVDAGSETYTITLLKNRL